MDFNDLNEKVKRLHVALGERYDADISSNITDTRITLADGKFEHRTSFGHNNPEKNQSLVVNAIHNIASLKDIIKSKLSAKGEDPQIYENLINDNLHLSLITDLDNKEKHGDPLAFSNRSGMDPKIINIEQALRGRGITNVSFTTDFTTGISRLDSVEGNVKIIVTADIVDHNGKLIMSLNEMLENAASTIEIFLNDQRLT